MKNAIKYFYNLDVDSIRQVDDTYFLVIHNEDYCLEKYDGDINAAYNYSKTISWCHQIVENLNGKFITIINDLNYVLLKLKCINRKITLNDVYEVNRYYVYHQAGNNNYNWDQLWEQKIDYLEYQMSQIGKKFPIIRESFSYFDGLTENAIQFYKTIKNNQINMFVSHNRIKFNSSLIELYNPLNLLIDSSVRDVAEYFKSSFFEKQDISALVKEYINVLSKEEVMYFFARMLFPSFYFDLYEEIIGGHKEEKCMYEIINNISDYETMLKDIYIYIRNVTGIINIEWLIKT